MLNLSNAFNMIRVMMNSQPVEIYDIYLGSQDTEDEDTLHFINYYWPLNFFTHIGRTPQEYTPLGIKRGGLAKGSQCEIERASFSVDDVNGGITYYASRRKFRNKKIVVRLVFRDQLDSADNAKIMFEGRISAISFVQKKNTRVVSIGATPKIGSLKYKTGWPYSIKCNCQFGDEFCKQDLGSSANSKTGYVEEATDITIKDSTLLTQGDDYWNLGYIEFLSGPAVGTTRGINDFDGLTNTITFDYELENIPLPGNLYKIVRGCDKTLEMCQDEYNNDENFHGFHTIPLRVDNV